MGTYLKEYTYASNKLDILITAIDFYNNSAHEDTWDNIVDRNLFFFLL